MEIRQLLRAIFTLILTATIVGCGGGGGGGTPETPPGSTANSTPTANAGPDQNVTTGTLASLNGSSSSDADGDSLTYLWSTTSKPNGSASSLSSTTAANPQFSADVDGQYTFQLVVNDGELNSSPDSVTVTS
ncbi:PKD domain-containing protein, partial [Zhongshania marina]